MTVQFFLTWWWCFYQVENPWKNKHGVESDRMDQWFHARRAVTWQFGKSFPGGLDTSSFLFTTYRRKQPARARIGLREGFLSVKPKHREVTELHKRKKVPSYKDDKLAGFLHYIIGEERLKGGPTAPILPGIVGKYQHVLKWMDFSSVLTGCSRPRFVGTNSTWRFFF